MAQLDASRPLSRVWDMFSDFGYSKNTQLQVAGSTVDAGSFTDGFAGVGVHRQFGRNFRGFMSYQFNELGFDTACPLGASPTGACSNTSQRQMGSIGVDWTPRPIRLELILRPAIEAGGTGTEMMENRELTMDDYLAMLRRRMKVILIPALLAPLAGFLVSYAFSAKYTSQSLVLVDAAEDSRCGGAAGLYRRSDAAHHHDPAAEC